MFQIKYRIVDNIDMLKEWSKNIFDNEGDLEGFFQMNFNGKHYGYYHKKDIKVGEQGFYLITHWFEMLIKVYLAFEISAYVALSDIESFSTWIEFKRIDKDTLEVSIIECEKNEVDPIVIKQFDKYTYSDWKNAKIKLKDFKDEIVKKSNLYIEELRRINSKLLESKRISNLKLLLDQINE